MKPAKTKVPKKKISLVKEISKLMNEKRTILIASVKNLPASQFQEISKKLRSKAKVMVIKKNMMMRAIDESKSEPLEKIKNYVQDSTAVLFSDSDSFELASDLIESKSPARAKAGQEAASDIVIEAGPTDLVPGPAISELGALGIQIQIDKGKIAIKEPKTIVKKGEKISESAVSVMNKLDIKPFSVGFIPIAAFDTKEKKLYDDIKIDREGVLNELKSSFSKALAFAAEIGYFAEETVKIMIGKAGREEMAMEKIIAHTSENKISGEENK